MKELIAKLLQRPAIAADQSSTASVGERLSEGYGQPKVEPGSTLDTMASLGANGAVEYAGAVVAEIDQIVSACTLANAATPVESVLEQIHGLKNALAPIGSAELLAACEQLRRDASRADRISLELRFKALAKAAAILVKDFQSNVQTHNQGNHG
ncbi:hypothetical protein VDS34_17985 [Xanthomonas campestris pv. campestris]|uniref:hypothetical protein n=2 Tax=Xanthomonas campestris TaxID=339 RepID=UPI0025A1CB37|nr:hypothetical protein [Xanthomonas campestris]MDM7672494.1 hypothetical protein [Xanthomonas campestris pv. campestris]MDM7685213.1 hypothetical protein [Xanthomonas campestris pv. campestris]MDM7693433.1 hypothetical protein [Xanthomonas campestris pv. campestris]MDM7697613.1 hypothetical protein [Xanthomonas campestris pv. campestris]MDM7756116.1 hypothetical protein [Xanthomonas campestris pv. campestris]